MHAAYMDYMREAELSPQRRAFLRGLGTTLVAAGTGALANDAAPMGFKGSGRMNMASGEDWIDTLF